MKLGTYVAGAVKDAQEILIVHIKRQAIFLGWKKLLYLKLKKYNSIL